MPTTLCLLCKDRGIHVFDKTFCFFFFVYPSIKNNKDLCVFWPILPPLNSGKFHFLSASAVFNPLVITLLSKPLQLSPVTYAWPAKQTPRHSVRTFIDSESLTPRLGGGTSTTLLHRLASSGPWRPQKTFPVNRSTHPLDLACTREILHNIHQRCLQEGRSIVARLPWHQLLVITSSDLRMLLSHSSPISDSIMTYYLEKFTQHYGITYLATSFLYTLRSQGWARLQSYFAGYRNRHRHNSRPRISGESAIILPCFVDNCHWVTVVRREVNNKVLFLYADDLNREGTEDSIRVLLSTKTTTEFYPPTAEWIKCYNFTYRPHSNECGPRALLASTLLAVHPNPSAHTLMPLMHKNLAQIARTWIGGQLLQPEFDEAAILPFLGTSHPFHLTYRCN
jgi:hypothetical protein